MRMDVDAVRVMLREGRGPRLARRRRMAGVAALGIVDFTVMSLYQLGLLRRLPDLPGPWFDSNRVNVSRSAYPLGVPDGPLGGLLCAGVLALAGVGVPQARRPSAVSYVLVAATAVGAGGAVKYLWDMFARQKVACPYCLFGAAVNFGLFADSLLEVLAARRPPRMDAA